MTALINTHGLKNGDVISYYGCKFRLRNRRVFTGPDCTKYDAKGTVEFDTDLVEFKAGSMPKGWAETCVVQGNKNASWHVLERGA